MHVLDDNRVHMLATSITSGPPISNSGALLRWIVLLHVSSDRQNTARPRSWVGTVTPKPLFNVVHFPVASEFDTEIRKAWLFLHQCWTFRKWMGYEVPHGCAPSDLKPTTIALSCTTRFKFQSSWFVKISCSKIRFWLTRARATARWLHAKNKLSFFKTLLSDVC